MPSVTIAASKHEAPGISPLEPVTRLLRGKEHRNLDFIACETTRARLPVPGDDRVQLSVARQAAARALKLLHVDSLSAWRGSFGIDLRSAEIPRGPC